MISLAHNDEYGYLKELWKQAFGPEGADEFYEAVSGHNQGAVNPKDKIKVFVYKINSEIVAMLHYIPCCYRMAGNLYNGAYLYAITTKKEYRGRNICGRLLEYVRNEAVSDGCSFIFLIPADEGLYGYYKKFGYEEIYGIKDYSNPTVILPGEIKKYTEWEILCDNMADTDNNITKKTGAMLKIKKELPVKDFRGLFPY